MPSTWQRLESASQPGTDLVSRAVERAARRDVRFRDEPVEAFEALERASAWGLRAKEVAFLLARHRLRSSDNPAAALQEAGRSALTAYPGPRAQLGAAAREAEDLLRRAESGKTRP